MKILKTATVKELKAALKVARTELKEWTKFIKLLEEKLHDKTI